MPPLPAGETEAQRSCASCQVHARIPTQGVWLECPSQGPLARPPGRAPSGVPQVRARWCLRDAEDSLPPGRASWSGAARSPGSARITRPADVGILLGGSAARLPEPQMAQCWASRAQPCAQHPAASARAAAWGTVLTAWPAGAGGCVSAGFLPLLPSRPAVISPGLPAPGLE